MYSVRTHIEIFDSIKSCYYIGHNLYKVYIIIVYSYYSKTYFITLLNKRIVFTNKIKNKNKCFQNV